MQQHVTFVEKLSQKKVAKDKNYRKVRDNGHITGKYKGEACSICNLRLHVSLQNKRISKRV